MILHCDYFWLGISWNQPFQESVYKKRDRISETAFVSVSGIKVNYVNDIRPIYCQQHFGLAICR